LSRTVDDVLTHARGAIEVIVIIDGASAGPSVSSDPRVTLVTLPEPIGQRAATNLAARLSCGRYVMKLDGHCAVSDGFDVELVTTGDGLGHDVTQIPAQYNLHAFNWRCRGCGHETYQGPDLTLCVSCGEKGTPGGPFERVIYWDLLAGGVPGKHVRTEQWRFDHDLHFQYGGRRKPEVRDGLIETMSSLGACFVMRRERFDELGELDEACGSWGQFGVEIGCKSWLSGGRQVTNTRAWFAHLFRTQGGSFSFPYAQPTAAVASARKYSHAMWLHNAWPQQSRPLSWLVEKFAPLGGWHDPAGAKRLAQVTAAGQAFQAPRPPGIQPRAPSKGLVYYSDCRGDATILDAVRRQIVSAAPDYPIVWVTLRAIAQPFTLSRTSAALTGAWRARNLVLELERSHLTMFRQILAGLEALDTDVAFLVEHDVLYDRSHFDYTPLDADTFYYNQRTWKVNAETGHALHYRCNQTSGLCANRQLLVAHYRARIARVEREGFSRRMGFEPGTRQIRHGGIDDHGHESWMSAIPNIDIRHGHNLTQTRWRQDQFRNQKYCQGWIESDRVPGWGITQNRFKDFLSDLSSRHEVSNVE